MHPQSYIVALGYPQPSTNQLTWLAANRELIQHLKHWAPGHLYATSLAPPAAQQILSAIRLLRGEDGSDRGARKLAQLRRNSDYFRGRLLDMGCNVLGDWGSPVMVRPLADLVRCSLRLKPCQSSLSAARLHQEPIRKGDALSSSEHRNAPG